MPSTSSVVTRFAPSPTGHLHIGGARTAIFSYLLARQAGGAFLLRVEDTDRARSKAEYTEAILDSMSWLGLACDGEAIYQSAREDAHNRAVDRLLAEGKAYVCDCTPEQVEVMRETARAKGEKPKYDGSCREKGLTPGPGRVVRFKTPVSGKVVFDDAVKGTIAVDNRELDDMILRRGDGAPTYNLAVVVDDHEMGVTHVLRGDDHVNNTPRQIHLYEALGWDVPVFAHVPMILGPDKKKLSKRHGAASVVEYRDLGYLPEAMLNYLVRLGWSHGDQEIFSMAELVELFGLAALSSSPAALDPEKLNWLNGQYIQQKDPAALAELVLPFLAREGVAAPDTTRLTALMPLYQPRAQTLVELAAETKVFLIPDADVEYDEQAVAKFLQKDEAVREHLTKIRDGLAELADFDEDSIQAFLETYMEREETTFKVVAQPLRVSVTGRTRSPGIGETLAVLGKASTLARIDRALSL